MPDRAIDDLIPHRGRMKLIGSIVQVSNDIAVTSAVVADTWPLCARGFSEPDRAHRGSCADGGRALLLEKGREQIGLHSRNAYGHQKR